MANIQNSINQALSSFQWGASFLEKRPQIQEMQKYHEAQKQADAYKVAYDASALEMKNAKSEWEKILRNPKLTEKRGDIKVDKDQLGIYAQTSGNYANQLSQLKNRFPTEWATNLEANEAQLKEAKETHSYFKKASETASRLDKQGIRETIITLQDKLESTAGPQEFKQELEQKAGVRQ